MRDESTSFTFPTTSPNLDSFNTPAHIAQSASKPKFTILQRSNSPAAKTESIQYKEPIKPAPSVQPTLSFAERQKQYEEAREKIFNSNQS